MPPALGGPGLGNGRRNCKPEFLGGGVEPSPEVAFAFAVTSRGVTARAGAVDVVARFACRLAHHTAPSRNRRAMLAVPSVYSSSQ